jgi:hypothetical protein
MYCASFPLLKNSSSTTILVTFFFSKLEMSLLDLQYNISSLEKKKVTKIVVDDEFFKSGKEAQYIYAKEPKK